MLFGQFQENARPCYANAKTLMFDATLYPIDQTGYDELAPYLWSPFLPSYDDIVSGLATGLIDNGWFDEATVGVIAIESDLSQRVYDEQFLPRLTAAGVEVASYNTIDPTDGTAFNNDQLQAIVNFKQAGVNKVVGIGGSRLVSWFIDYVDHAELRARLCDHQPRRSRVQRLQLPRDAPRLERNLGAPRLRCQ